MKVLASLLIVFMISCTNLDIESETIEITSTAIEGFIISDEPEPVMTGRITDARGLGEDLFLLDQTGMVIRVFKKSGELLTNIGTRGRGPGQVMNIQTFTVTYDENGSPVILIMDDINQKLLFFKNDGSLIKEHMYVEGFYLRGKLIEADLKERTLTILAKRPVGDLSDCLIHMIDMDDFSTIRCFGSYTAFGYSPQSEANYISQIHPGSFVKTDHGYIFSPFLFTGNLAVINDESESMLQSKEINISKPWASRKTGYEYQLSYRGRQYQGVILSRSEGLYYVNNTLYHIYSLVQDKKNYFIERYSKDLSESRIYKLEGWQEELPAGRRYIFFPIVNNTDIYYFDQKTNLIHILSLNF